MDKRDVTQEQFGEVISAKQLQEKLAAAQDTISGSRNWLDDFFNKRERCLIANCIHYAHNDPGGLPGHMLMLLVSKMAAIIDMQDSQ